MFEQLFEEAMVAQIRRIELIIMKQMNTILIGLDPKRKLSPADLRKISIKYK